mgnify:CR=1 FL=1
MTASPLDALVLQAAAALRDGGVPDPDVLCLLGTGTEALPFAFTAELTSVALHPIGGMPDLWREASLSFGLLDDGAGGTATIWVLDDLGLDAPMEPGEPAFARGFPVWLAAYCGASLLLHTSAAGNLGAGPKAGTLAVLRDHINLSGATPLHALGMSKLGPLFPDVSNLHIGTLRQEAVQLASQQGIALAEVVAACAAPVSLATPAERAWFLKAGAEIWIQGLANPLLAAAHAGLSALALTAITAEGDGPTDIPAMLSASSEAAPKMAALLHSLTPAIVRFVGCAAGESK